VRKSRLPGWRTAALTTRIQTSTPAIPMCNSTDRVSHRIACRHLCPGVGLSNMAQPAIVPAVDWNAIRRRLRLIRAALGLPAAEVEAVIDELNVGNEANLIAFAHKHGQSLDWIVRGDLAPMLQMLGRSRLSNRTDAPGGRQR
jgi:hypothetical protein